MIGALTKNFIKIVQKFRKKPVVIEAVQWTGNNLKGIIDFAGWHESAKQKWTWEGYETVIAEEGLKNFTLEGKMNADVGDWIIKGVKGEFYPCKPDVFKATYELNKHGKESRYCIIGFEFNEPMKHAEFYQSISNEILQTTDDWEKVKFFPTLEEAEKTRLQLREDYNDYGWYAVICNAP